MPVFKRRNSQFYSFDFRVQGARYTGNTGKTTKREAEQFEESEKRRIKTLVALCRQPMTMQQAVGLYWEEVGQHHKNSDTTLVTLAWLESEIGKNVLIASITDRDISRMITKRRLEKDVQPATVNRSVTQPMRAILTRAHETWGQPVNKIKWSKLLLKEPEERVRELMSDEETRLFAALRKDYHAIVKFSLLTGCRMQECLDLSWRQIDWHNRSMRIKGKGEKTRTVPLSDAVYDLLRLLPRADGNVFTYESKRADKAPRGKLLPITREGLKSTFDRALTNAKIEDFSFHDLRHTCATRLLRATGNLRLVKDLLGHSDMNTTLKYAHVTTEDLLKAMNHTQNAAQADVGGDKELETKEDSN
jgi:integrase